MNRIASIFIPSEKNKGVPGVLSRTAFVFYLLFTLVLVASPAIIRERQLASVGQMSSFSGREILDLVNASRAELGLPMLTENKTLEKAALQKAEDMFSKQYFAHVSPDNKTPWQFLKDQNYVYTAAGENLAIDFPTPGEAHQGLMASPTHRSNILSKLYTEAGIVVLQGIFDNHPSVIIVQYFGNPKTAVAATPSVQNKVKTNLPTPKSVSTKTPQTKGTTPITSVPKSNPPVAAPKPAIDNSFHAAPINPVIETTTASPISPARKNLVRPVDFRSAMIARILETNYPYFRIGSFMIIFLLLVGMTFMMSRNGSIPHTIAFNATLLIAVLGYVAFTGDVQAFVPHVSTQAFMTF